MLITAGWYKVLRTDQNARQNEAKRGAVIDGTAGYESAPVANPETRIFLAKNQKLEL